MRRFLQLVAALVLAGAVISVMLGVRHPAVFARVLTPENALQAADAILVFNGDPNYERTLEAVRLYRLGCARYLVFSGRGVAGDSADSMAEVARVHGVPDAAILREERATSTYENVLFVRPILARYNVRGLILVTSPYHQLRAYLVARHLLRHVRLINHPVRHHHDSAHAWWRDRGTRRVVFREYEKITDYLLTGRI